MVKIIILIRRRPVWPDLPGNAWGRHLCDRMGSRGGTSREEDAQICWCTPTSHICAQCTPQASTCSGYTCTHKLCTGTRNVHANICTQVYTYTFAHRYMHGHIDAHMQIHAQKCTHRYIYAYRDTFTQAYTAHMFAHRYTQAYIYTQIEQTQTVSSVCIYIIKSLIHLSVSVPIYLS